MNPTIDHSYPEVAPPMRETRVEIILVEPQQQKVWGRLAVINFTFGGAGAGLYLLSVWFQMMAAKISFVPSIFALRIASAAFVCFGLLAVASEAGRPFHGRFLLGNLRRSWMSRETAAAILFIPLAVITSIFTAASLVTLTAIAAMLFIVSQGFIIYRARAIPAWNLPALPMLFISSAFAAGSGILLMLPADAGITAGNVAVLITTLVCCVADLFLWVLYICPPAIDQPVRLATKALRARSSVIWTIAIGRMIPIMIVLLVLFGPVTAHASAATLTIAGFLIFCGSWAQKAGIIRKSGQLTPLQFTFQSAFRHGKVRSETTVVSH